MCVGAGVDQVAQGLDRRKRPAKDRRAQLDGEVGSVVAGQVDADRALEPTGEESERVGVVRQASVVDRQDFAVGFQVNDAAA